MKNKQREYMWVRCPHCGHKLFKITNTDGVEIHESTEFGIEIKCHSCKWISGLYFVKDENGGLAYGEY